MEYSIKEEILTDIADAIREKSDNPDEYYPSEMPAAIRSIRGGSNVNMEDNPEGGINLTVNDEVRNLALESEVAAKQEKLESGINIKTINGESLLGNENIEIKSGSIVEMIDNPDGGIDLNVDGNVKTLATETELMEGRVINANYIANSTLILSNGEVMSTIEISSERDYYVTNFIPVIPGSTIYYECGRTDNAVNKHGLVWYDENKVAISNVKASNWGYNSNITLPHNAYFVRATFTPEKYVLKYKDGDNLFIKSDSKTYKGLIGLNEGAAAWTETEQGAGLNINGEEKVLVLLSELDSIIEEKLKTFTLKYNSETGTISI